MTQRPTLESIAKVLIINSQNQGLVLTLDEHRLYPEKSFTPDLPGGIIDKGESEQQGVIREVKEECGIALHPLNLTLVYTKTTYFEKEGKSITKMFYIAHVGNSPMVELSWEHSDYSWVPLANLQNITFGSFFKEAITYSQDKGII